MPKTRTERQREYRERLKSLQPPKPPRPAAMTTNERVRLYRERKRLAKRIQEEEQKVNNAMQNDLNVPSDDGDEMLITPDQVVVILEEDAEVGNDDTDNYSLTRREFDTTFKSDESRLACFIRDQMLFNSDLRTVSSEGLQLLALQPPESPRPAAMTVNERVRLYRERKRLAKRIQEEEQKVNNAMQNNLNVPSDEGDEMLITPDQVAVILEEDSEIGNDDIDNFSLTRREFETTFKSDESRLACFICDQLLFNSDLRTVPSEGLQLLALGFPHISDFESHKVCVTCYKYLKDSKMPLSKN